MPPKKVIARSNSTIEEPVVAAEDQTDDHSVRNEETQHLTENEFE